MKLNNIVNSETVKNTVANALNGVKSLGRHAIVAAGATKDVFESTRVGNAAKIAANTLKANKDVLVGGGLIVAATVSAIKLVKGIHNKIVDSKEKI